MPERPTALITRPEPRASVTAARVADLGFAPVIAPLLCIRPRPARLPDPKRLQAVLATSANALPGLPKPYRRLPLFTVGDATANSARALGYATVTSADGNALALAALVARDCRPEVGPLLLAVGVRQGEAFARSLRAHGFAVLRRTVYTARPVRQLPDVIRPALEQGRVAVALFYSSETARTFAHLAVEAKLASTLTKVTAVAIGEPAAAVLRHLPFRAVRVAVRPTEGGLLSMIA